MKVRTQLEESHANLAEVMMAHRAVLANELAAVDLALEALGYTPTNSTAPPRPPRRQTAKCTAKRAATGRRKPKEPKRPAAKAAAKDKSAQTKLAAPLARHEPAKRIGRLPTAVLVKAIDDEAERRKFVDGLLGRGYRRTKPLERLAPGLYDVCIRDGEATVTWWPRAEEA